MEIETAKGGEGGRDKRESQAEKSIFLQELPRESATTSKMNHSWFQPAH